LEGIQGSLFAMAGTAVLVLFAIYARRQEPVRYGRAAPWLIAVLLVVGVLLLIGALTG
jgi:glycerol uptake facilitator-like aquaporin